MQSKNNEKVAALLFALRRKALTILPNIAMDTQKGYTAAVSALVTRFGSHHLKHFYTYQLKALNQHQSETLQQHGIDTERLVRLAYPDAIEN